MSSTMWCTVNSNLFHKRSPIAVIVIAIKKSFSILCMKKIFAIGARLIPVFIVRQELICNRDFSDSVFSFAVNYIKILFFQMHILFLQIKKFRDTCAIIEQHEDDLIIFILFHCPGFCDFFFCEFCMCVLVWIAVFVLGDINKSKEGWKTDPFRSILQKAIGKLRGFIQFTKAIRNGEFDVRENPLIRYNLRFDVTPAPLPELAKGERPSSAL